MHEEKALGEKLVFDKGNEEKKSSFPSFPIKSKLRLGEKKKKKKKSESTRDPRGRKEDR